MDDPIYTPKRPQEVADHYRQAHQRNIDAVGRLVDLADEMDRAAERYRSLAESTVYPGNMVFRAHAASKADDAKAIRAAIRGDEE